MLHRRAGLNLLPNGLDFFPPDSGADTGTLQKVASFSHFNGVIFRSHLKLIWIKFPQRTCVDKQ